MPKTARGRKTREKLLTAAEAEFGEKGFHAVGISDITRTAGVALGTFYVYFESKEEIFRDLVGYLSHRTRGWIAERIADAPDRLSAERMGLKAYLEYARQHPGLYRIISESEFVAHDAFVTHYEDFSQAYRENLEAATRKGEFRDSDHETLAWAIMGMAVFLGLRFSVWQADKDPGEIADTVVDLIAEGLRKKG